MPDKLTDKKCKELLEYKAKVNCEMCDLKGKGSCITCTYNLIKQFLEIFNRLQAENDTLRTCVEQIPLIRKDGKSPLSLLTTEIKAEAYKEFAERLHEELRMYGVKDKFNKAVFLNVVDNSKKELVGEDK